MHSLHRHTGGKQSTRVHLPSESAGFALAVGAALQWCKLRDCSSKAFYTAIAFEVKRCESTDVDWTCDEMVFFVQDMLFGSITQIGLEKYLQRKFHGKDKEGRVAATKEFVHSVIYRYLASVESGVRLT